MDINSFISLKMKLKKILDTESLQGYQIIDPTVAFKKKYNKKYIVSIKLLDKEFNDCTNTLPFFLSVPIVRGYIFTYNSKIPKFRILHDDEDDSEKFDNSTYPECLDQYFPSADKDNVDIIFKCIPKNDKIVSPRFVESLIIRSDSLHLLERKSYEDALSHKNGISKTISEKLLKLLNTNLSTYKNMQEWIERVVDTCPLDVEGDPIKFPDEITMKDINEDVKHDDIFVMYDYRPTKSSKSRKTDYDYENLLETSIEDAFEDPELPIKVFDNYNGILERMKKECDSQRIEYKYDKKNNCIVIAFKNLRKLKMTYDMTDFL